MLQTAVLPVVSFSCHVNVYQSSDKTCFLEPQLEEEECMEVVQDTLQWETVVLSWSLWVFRGRRWKDYGRSQ